MTVRTNEPGMTLKHLKADDYHEIFDEQVSVRSAEPDWNEPVGVAPGGGIWVPGQRVDCPDGTSGKLTGFAVERGCLTMFARVNGRLYHISVLKRA